jgi:hypothetical protein
MMNKAVGVIALLSGLFLGVSFAQAQDFWTGLWIAPP